MKITAHDQTFEVKGLKVTPVSIRCTALSIPLSIGQFIYRTAHIWVITIIKKVKHIIRNCEY